MFKFEELHDELKQQILLHLPDFYRIVDIDTHEVYEYRHHELIPSPQKCYHSWNMHAPCTNCTSCRAIKEQKPVIKLGFQNKRIYLINSLPITLQNHAYSLELIQDVSDSFLLNKNIYNDTDEVLSLISLFNERVMKDGFTNLYNKQYLSENLSIMLTLAKHQQFPLCLAILDIDQFKQANDDYGHLFGDKVISKVANEFLNITYDLVRCARIGGDEFAIIFEKIEKEEAITICEQVIHNISQIAIEEHPSYQITMSYGIVSMQEHDTVESMIERADQNMYSMKNKSRDS